MRILIDGHESWFGDSIKIVETLMKRENKDEYPERLKWAVQSLYKHEGEWIEICRIDNYLHHGFIGSHIHVYGTNEVRREMIEYAQALDLVRTITERVLRDRFKVIAGLKGG